MRSLKKLSLDSKSLSEKDRENIFEKINEENKFCGFAVKSLSPNAISTGMLGRVKYNLNELSHDTAMSLIDTLYNQEGLKITHVYLDTADSIYPCVSAASICAKVTRDTLLKNWNFTENCNLKEYGSGYPGDPMTKKFLDASLNNVFGFVKLVRFSWSTAALKIKKSCVAVKWPDAFEDGEDGDEEIVDVTEENEQAPKKEAKRGAKSNKQSKLSVAVATDKNNKSILNFFQKPQKRTLSTANSGQKMNLNQDLIKFHYYDIYLSYHKNQINDVERFYNRFKQSGLRVWYDQLYKYENINLFDDSLAALTHSFLFVCFWSKSYKKSLKCRAEYSTACEQKTKIIAFLIDDLEPSDELTFKYDLGFKIDQSQDLFDYLRNEKFGKIVETLKKYSIDEAQHKKSFQILVSTYYSSLLLSENKIENGN
ncbi:unnamed protein product [Brachionus calyciflorus]|uniref:Ribonuclease n=1 Tax=Brachionus calyciflorus TaxID=104777 RepID=A0A813MC59_9BILA|nr:unnamed protein product [Brachionus calyciflorus]